MHVCWHKPLPAAAAEESEQRKEGVGRAKQKDVATQGPAEI